MMPHKNIHKIAIAYDRTDLVKYFVEQFNIDRMHDGAPLKVKLIRLK